MQQYNLDLFALRRSIRNAASDVSTGEDDRVHKAHDAIPLAPRPSGGVRAPRHQHHREPHAQRGGDTTRRRPEVVPAINTASGRQPSTFHGPINLVVIGPQSHTLGTCSWHVPGKPFLSILRLSNAAVSSLS